MDSAENGRNPFKTAERDCCFYQTCVANECLSVCDSLLVVTRRPSL